MSRESTIRKGLRRDQIPAGELLGRHNANLLLQLLGAACNMELVGGQVIITENKIMLKPGPGSGGSGGDGTGTGSDFQGVYVPGETYNDAQWVVIQSGPSAGAWISTADANALNPTTGVNWIQFSALNQWF